MISGLTFRNAEVKLSAYADDFALILDGSERSLRESLNCCEKFRAISGLQLNEQKTKAMWIGKYSDRNSICPEVNLSWVKGPIEYLGVKIHAGTTRLEEINYQQKISR